jgi:hypothetical protein
LARSEGLVLRYLADAYRAMRQTLPAHVRTEPVEDLVEWLGETVRQIDSSLLDEWEQLRAGKDEPASRAIDERPPRLTANTRAFRVLVRNALFRRVELAAVRDWDGLGDLDGESGWPATAWREALAPYFDEHQQIGTGANARGPALLIVEEHPDRWMVRQIFDDPAEDHDWGLSAEVDLAGCDDAGTAVIRVTAVGQL